MKYANSFPKRPENSENNSSAGYFIAAREANTNKEFTDTFIDSLLCEFDIKERPDIKNMCKRRCNGKEIKLLEFKGHFFYILYTSQIFENEIFNSILAFCMTIQTGKGLNSDTINKTLLMNELECMYKQLFPMDKDNRLLRRLIYLTIGELQEANRKTKKFEEYENSLYGERRKTTKDRIKTYNSMKKNGSKDAEIFRKIMLEEYPDEDRLKYKKGKNQTANYKDMMGVLRKWKSQHKGELFRPT